MERDTFAGLNEKQFNKLKRDTPWLKADYLSKDELNDIVSEIANKQGRHIKLSQTNDNEHDTLANKLDIILFYNEIKERRSTKTQDRRPLIHQYSKDQQEYIRLNQWHKFIDTTEPFILPVQFQVRKGIARTTKETLLVPSLNLSDMELKVVVQNLLIESHFNPTLITTPMLVIFIEHILNANLVKLVFFRETVCFFFEWIDPEPFVFVMVFGLTLKCNAKVRRLAQNSVITLFRKNLYEIEDEQDEEEISKKKKPQKQKKKNDNIVSKRSLLSSLLEDDDNPSEEEEEEEGGGGGGMDVEEPIISEKIQHINSMSIEKENIIKPFIYSIRTSYISYWLSGYVKRD